MRKRFLCILTALTLAVAPALAEGGLISALATPTPAPSRVVFERGDLFLTLPAGMEILDGEALELYEAAVQFDYPETGSAVLVAMDATRDAALILTETESTLDCLTAAQQAAEALIGNPELAREAELGENRCAHFTCAVNGQIFHLYYFSDGARLLTAGFSGLSRDEVEETLAELRFQTPAAPEIEEALP